MLRFNWSIIFIGELKIINIQKYEELHCYGTIEIMDVTMIFSKKF